MFAYKVVLTAYGTYLAIITKDVAKNWNESLIRKLLFLLFAGKEIGTAVYNVAVIGLLLVPTLYGIDETSTKLSLILRILVVGYVVVFTLSALYFYRYFN